MSTAATTPSPGEPQAKIGPVGRVFGALFNPTETFADIARKPSWIAPVVFMTVTGLAISFALAQRVDWVQVTRQQIERVPMAARQFEQIPPERQAEVIERSAARAKWQRYGRGAVGSTFLVFFFGAVYWGAYNLLGGAGVRFMTAAGIVAHASLPLAIKEIIGIPIVFLKEASDIDPENFVASNVAAFLPSDAPLWQIAVGSGFDLFAFWLYALLIIGFAQVNPKKVSLGKSFWIVLTVWAVFTLAGTGLAWLFS